MIYFFSHKKLIHTQQPNENNAAMGNDEDRGNMLESTINNS